MIEEVEEDFQIYFSFGQRGAGCCIVGNLSGARGKSIKILDSIGAGVSLSLHPDWKLFFYCILAGVPLAVFVPVVDLYFDRAACKFELFSAVSFFIEKRGC